MKQNIIHIGLDVDDTQYHGAAFNKETGEVVDFRSRPTLKGLSQQLDRMARHFKGYKIKLCYEASYIGYCLQRDLISNGIHCDIVSPSSIPSPRGKAIKTDRCLRRLNKKGNRLLLAGKHPNKVKVACAREMVGFVWESLNQAAA